MKGLQKVSMFSVKLEVVLNHFNFGNILTTSINLTDFIHEKIDCAYILDCLEVLINISDADQIWQLVSNISPFVLFIQLCTRLHANIFKLLARI